MHHVCSMYLVTYIAYYIFYVLHVCIMYLVTYIAYYIFYVLHVCSMYLMTYIAYYIFYDSTLIQLPDAVRTNSFFSI